MPAALVRNLPRSTRTPALPHPSARFFGLKLALMPVAGEGKDTRVLRSHATDGHSTLTRASHWLLKRQQPARRLPSPAKAAGEGPIGGMGLLKIPWDIFLELS